MWQPGVPVTTQTPLEPMLKVLGFGQQDIDSYATIAEKFKARSVITVGDLFGISSTWQREELLGCLRTLELKKSALSYVGAIEAAVGDTMGTERTATTPPAGFAKMTTGGNMSGACIKQEPSGTFLPRQYIPDGRVYQGFYAHGGAAFMSTEQEKLYLDYLWLDAQANPEKSLGDYLPDGMAKQLGMLHDALLPPFKPTNHGTPRAQPRPAAKTIALRFQNGRQQHYPRLILDEKFTDYLGEKALKAMDNSFVLCTDERLQDNARNDFFGNMIKVREGKLPVSRRPKPHSYLPPAHQPPHSPSMPARAQSLAVIFPGKENGEAGKENNKAPKAAVKPKPATRPPASAIPPQPGHFEGWDEQGDDDFDGLVIDGGGGPLPPAPAQPKPAARARATEGGAMSKKGAAAAKRAGGVGKPAVPPRAADSSDDEDSDAESGAGEGAAAGAEGGPKHKAKKRKKGAPPAPKGTLSLSHPTPPSPHSCAHFHY